MEQAGLEVADRAEEGGGIEGGVEGAQGLFDGLAEVRRGEGAGIGGLGAVVVLFDPAAMAFLGNEFGRGEEEVEVEAEGGVELLHHLEGRVAFQTAVPDETTDHGPVLLLDEAGVVLPPGAGAREGDPLPQAVGQEVIVDELAAVVRI